MKLREFREIGNITYRSEGLNRDGREVWVAIPEWRIAPQYMDVLDKGYVHLDSYMASDEMVADSARVLAERKIIGSLSDRDADLIRSMIAGRHGTPFEHCVFRFRIKVPIFVVREWHRHRIASYNEISMRWMKGEPEFYVPSNIRQVEPGKRKIDYSYIDVSDDEARTEFLTELSEFHRQAYTAYEKALELGIAPEQARYFLPNTFYTVMIWTVNARSLMNFLSLRNEDHAMFEIREYAKACESHFQRIMPITREAWMENGRRVP